MKEPSRQPDRVIHEAMGLCSLHYDSDMTVTCGICGYVVGPHNTHLHSPDYAKDLRPVFEWIAEDIRWSKFIDWYKSKFRKTRYKMFWLSWEMCGAFEKRNLIAEWIESTRE